LIDPSPAAKRRRGSNQQGVWRWLVLSCLLLEIGVGDEMRGGGEEQGQVTFDSN
jgi:hypothetical protein